MTGTLYVVATPIGNLDDMTIRGISTLEEVDLILAEDTRHTKKLLSKFSITSRLVSYHEHNESGRADHAVQLLKDGADVALVTDAGTPCISDPGYRVVAAARDEGIDVVPVPGASALTAAISVSGLATDAFVFIGFPPRKKARRKKFLADLAKEKKTLIFYESPKRAETFLKELAEIFGSRKCFFAREMTKMFEEYLSGTILEILEMLEEKKTVKGECVIVVSGAIDEEISPEELEAVIKQRIDASKGGLSAISREIAHEYNLPKARIYDLAIKIKEIE